MKPKLSAEEKINIRREKNRLRQEKFRKYWAERLKSLKNPRPPAIPAKDRKRMRAEENRQWRLNYLKDHPCVDCGELDPIVLDFDHRDPKDKKFTISRLIQSSYSREVITAEVAKCDIRCANCHRRKTWKDQQENKIKKGCF